MRVRRLIFPAIIALSLALARSGSGEESARQKPRTPVLVELFTSQGCSSCPPADAALAKLGTEQPLEGITIIPLAFHVDYWNNLGWIDPFSSRAFTERQNDYAASRNSQRIYTPQMVIDGAAEFVGSDQRRALAEIREAAGGAKIEVAIEAGIEGDRLNARIKIGPLPNEMGNETAEVLLAITEDGLHTDIPSGENAGRKMDFRSVVRELKALGPTSTIKPYATDAHLRIAPQWKRENLNAVAFVQERRTRRILGAAAVSLNPKPIAKN